MVTRPVHTRLNRIHWTYLFGVRYYHQNEAKIKVFCGHSWSPWMKDTTPQDLLPVKSSRENSFGGVQSVPLWTWIFSTAWLNNYQKLYIYIYMCPGILKWFQVRVIKWQVQQRWNLIGHLCSKLCLHSSLINVLNQLPLIILDALQENTWPYITLNDHNILC